MSVAVLGHMELNSIVYSQDQDLEALSITVMSWHTVCVWDL
jgi:hypothetical protein